MAERKQTRKPAAKAKNEVDRQLARYRDIRDFSSTGEPSGGKLSSAKSRLPFVIQKHAATRLHYDFRLGWRGVLKSWAVTKGPSYFTGDKRLAVQVEDHPIEYGGFEGTIPKGQYGGGTVLVWDQGTWEPVGDVDEGLAKGSLKFTLYGEKLKGRWTLVRMGGRAANESKPNWLLIKEHDGNERTADAATITEEAPDSVVTGRSLEQIAAAEDHVWQSHAVEQTTVEQTHRSRLQEKLQKAHLRGTPRKPPAKRATPAADKPGQSTAAAWLESTPEAPMPQFIAPQLATPAQTVPAGTHWLHELKLDGYRIQAHLHKGKRKGRVTLYTRSGLDWTHRMAGVARACEALPLKDMVLDGEVVALDAEGKPSFSKLQAAFEKGEAVALTYFVFDLLHLDGHDLRRLPLHARKALLAPLVEEAQQEHLVYSQHLEMKADEVYAHACELGAEGIISKRSDAPYTGGRGDAWLKLKCTHRQEFIIAGFTLPKDRGAGLGSLLLGYYRDSKLIHCGRCGTGFTQTTARNARKQLEALRQDKSPYAGALSAAAKKDAFWVRPELVCEIEFATWTADGSLRHASFQGMRADKPANEVVKEEPIAIAPGSSTEGEEQAAEKVTTAVSNKKPSVNKKAANASASLRISHPDKVLDPASGATKQQLADYYAAAAPAMLPHLAGRAASIVRCPNGTGAKCFFQKHANTGLPASIGSVLVPDRDDPKHSEPYIMVESENALAGLAQLGVLELHPWGSQASALEQPDRLIFDLDPDESLPWSTVVASARSIRDFLKEMHLETFVKSTGGKGLHIVAALEPLVEWPELRLFARGIAAAIESSDPKLYLIKMTKAARKGRIFLDWMRNERGATAIAPWSPRARAGMRVAAPLAWSELSDGPPAFAVANLSEWQRRLRPSANPWARMRSQPLAPGVLQAVLEQSGEADKQPPRRQK